MVGTVTTGRWLSECTLLKPEFAPGPESLEGDSHNETQGQRAVLVRPNIDVASCKYFADCTRATTG